MESNQTENLEKIIKISKVTSLQKKIIFIVFFVLLLCSFSFSVFAQEENVNSDYSNFEKINSFDIQAQINPDATVSVVETIDYHFGDQEKRGIFRTIPLVFTAKGEPDHTMLDIISVTDEKGDAYKYRITSLTQ